jgi:hypothetical protein
MIINLSNEHSKISYLEYLLGGDTNLETIVSNCIDNLWNGNNFEYDNYLDKLRNNIEYTLYTEIVDVITSIIEVKALKIKLTNKNKETLIKLKFNDNYFLIF